MNSETTRVSIELAHQTPQSGNWSGLDAGCNISRSLSEQGFQPELFMFADDIMQSQRPRSNFWRRVIENKGLRLQEELATEGVEFSWLYESDMIERGFELVNNLRTSVQADTDARLSQDGRIINFGRGRNRQRIKLIGYDEHKDLPSCEVMDLACYEHKLQESDVTVTVISENYQTQQERVRKLAGLLEWTMPVVVVYVDDEGGVLRQESWLER